AHGPHHHHQPHRPLRRARLLRARVHDPRTPRPGRARRPATLSNPQPHSAPGPGRTEMNCENSILIRAPLEKIFAATSNLESWPKLLPHYRWIRILSRDGNALIVNMAARRGWLPIQWTSRFEADARACELRFHHLKAFTKGMD